MKKIKYFLCTQVNVGTQEVPVFEQNPFPVEMSWSPANEEIAKREAHNGEYTVEDDGIEETAEPSHEERITDLEEALALLLSGVTE